MLLKKIIYKEVNSERFGMNLQVAEITGVDREAELIYFKDEIEILSSEVEIMYLIAGTQFTTTTKIQVLCSFA